MTLIEVLLAIAFLLVSLLAMTISVLGVQSLNKSERERRTAETALRLITEGVSAFSSASVDDPNGWAQTVSTAFAPGGNPGDTFDVFGLSPVDGENGVGTIQVLTDETLTDQEIGVDLGLPRDLDGDGEATNVDVSLTAGALPVLVQVRWTGARGDRQVVQGFYIVGY